MNKTNIFSTFISVLFSQVLLVNAVKDVASALRELITSTKNAAGKDMADPAMSKLKEAAKV